MRMHGNWHTQWWLSLCKTRRRMLDDCDRRLFNSWCRFAVVHRSKRYNQVVLITESQFFYQIHRRLIWSRCLLIWMPYLPVTCASTITCISCVTYTGGSTSEFLNRYFIGPPCIWSKFQRSFLRAFTNLRSETEVFNMGNYSQDGIVWLTKVFTNARAQSNTLLSNNSLDDSVLGVTQLFDKTLFKVDRHHWSLTDTLSIRQTSPAVSDVGVNRDEVWTAEWP